jgi:ribosomal protein L11 methyltransferase
LDRTVAAGRRMSWSVTMEAPPGERDQIIADLWEAGTTGITEEDDWLRAFFEEDVNPEALIKRFSSHNPRFERDEEHDWVRHAYSMWQPFPVGERFWLVPEWQEDPAPEGRFRLPMRSGLACGSGAHPATQLCIEALENFVQPGASVLDVGTGSGILAEAARLLGAVFIVGCDINHEATLIAKNNVAEIALFTGSLRSVRDAAFDVVVANLNAATIATLGREFTRVGQRVILSGFREEEQQSIEKQTRGAVRERLELDGWACLIF